MSSPALISTVLYDDAIGVTTAVTARVTADLAICMTICVTIRVGAISCNSMAVMSGQDVPSNFINMYRRTLQPVRKESL